MLYISFQPLKLYTEFTDLYTNYHDNYHILVSNVLIIDNNYLNLHHILSNYYYKE